MTAITRPRLAAIAAAGALLATLFVAGQAHARGPLTGTLKVENNRHRPVGIFVDGQRIGRVGPKETGIFRGVLNGVRVVGFRSGRHDQMAYENVSIPPNSTGFLRVRPVRGAALFKNNSGVDLRLELNGQNIGVVRAGERMETGRLNVGPHRVVATVLHPDARGKHRHITRDFHVGPGEREKVRFGKWMGRITVTNTFHRKARVLIDGERVARLRPGQSATFDVAPGRHEVALAKRGRILASDRVRVGSGKHRDVRLAVVWTGDLKITNHFRRPLTISIDGRVLGTIAGGDTQVFRVDAGKHRVVGELPWGKRFSRDVRVHEGRVDHVAFKRPHHHWKKGDVAWR